MAQCDIIDELQKRLVDHALFTIFSDLDLETLKNAELVSKGWQQSVIQCSVWKKTLEHKISRSSLWRTAAERITPILTERKSSPSYSKIIHLKVNSALQRLEENWKSGKASTLNHDLTRLDIRATVFQMDDGFIVYDSGGTLVVVDRTTLQKKNAIKYCESEQYSLSNYSYHFRKGVVVVGGDNGIIHVWDTSTGELVNRLSQLEDSSLKHVRFTNEVMVTASSPNIIPGSCDIVTIWNVRNFQDVSVINQIPFQDDCVELEMDEKFIVIVGASSGAETKQVHVLSQESHQIIQTLTYHSSMQFSNASMQYSNGLLLSAEPLGIRIVNVESGQCLSWIRCGWTRYDALRFNSKFIVAMEKRTKTVMIFDFPSALDPRKDLDKVCLSSFQWPSENIRKFRTFHMDDFQLVGAGFDQGANRTASFHVLDFF